MDYAVVNVKIDPKTKKEAQKVAEEMGIPLSTLLKSYIKQLVRTRKVGIDVSEEPSEYLIKALEESEKNLREGKTSPIFDNGEDAVKWLHQQIK